MNGLRIILAIRVPPKSKRAGGSENWTPLRNRLIEKMSALGISAPYGGDVELVLDLEERPGADIDNRIQGVFAMLDSVASGGGRPLRNDDQIKKLIFTRRYWSPGEDDVSVRAEILP